MLLVVGSLLLRFHAVELIPAVRLFAGVVGFLLFSVVFSGGVLLVLLRLDSGSNGGVGFWLIFRSVSLHVACSLSFPCQCFRIFVLVLV